MALLDWSGELRLLQAAHGLANVAPQAAHVRAACGCPVCSARAIIAALGRQELGTRAKSPPRPQPGGWKGGRFDTTS